MQSKRMQGNKIMLFEEYKERFYKLMENDDTWQSLTDKQRNDLATYTFENEELVADVISMIIEEKELN